MGMDLGLDGRPALVAAASSGLGKAVARSLAREGARVAICARGSARLQAAREELVAETGADILAIPCDVTESKQVDDLVEQVAGTFGSLEILVTNAGGPPPLSFADIDEALWEDALRLNLLSTIHLCRAAVPHMRQAGWGRIVAIASIAAKQPLGGLMLSNTSRAGVLGFIKSLANELAADGILANVVCPGTHRTPRIEEIARARGDGGGGGEDIWESFAEGIPLGRVGDPQELGDVVAFLCSQRASFVTGAVLQVDGGAYRGLI